MASDECVVPKNMRQKYVSQKCHQSCGSVGNVLSLFNEILQFKHVLGLKIVFQQAAARTKNLPDVKLCHTDWLLKTISFDSLYRELSPACPKQIHDKKAQNASSVVRSMRLGDVMITVITA